MVVAAMRSPSGASAAVLTSARASQVTLLANVALALEYETTCRLVEHQIAAGFSARQVAVFIDAVIYVGARRDALYVAAAASRSGR